MKSLPRPSKIVCVGRNYVAHAAEMGNEVPTSPLLFLKPPSALIQVGEPVVIPPDVGRVDYEGEIGVVIGRKATKISEADAWEFVAGIAPVNDITARDLQRADSQWSRAKGFDTFCPVGEMVPLADVNTDELSVVSRLNGGEKQRGAVGQMVFSIPFLISYVSNIMTLEPGDILATGTPEGVGPLAPGDVVEIEIPGLGTVTNPVVQHQES
jgi:2-keto-4-pentenoate hydratase/2-oxohepta-3-ene-1,7-dioic acid hydratase in catechol pathway